MNPLIDFQDPAFRADLIEQVGGAEYERILRDFMATFQHDGIRPVRSTRYGWVYESIPTGAVYVSPAWVRKHREWPWK
jgi:hypothetical protein